MKSRIVSVATTLIAAVALLVPQGVAADCLNPIFEMYRGYGSPGAFKLGAGANFGLGDSNDQTVLSADASYSFSEMLAVRLTVGNCSSGMVNELTYGFQVLSDVWASEDAKTKLQGSFGFNRVDFGGSNTTVLPLQLNVRYAVAPTVDVWGGPELAFNRFAVTGFSNTDSTFGLNAGVTADLTESVSFRTGLSSQFWEGNTVYGLSTAISYKIPQSN